tara:strand:+ start:80 stop:1003 length:924 start_codon:yes stop_codon:yes gene_type:complete
MSLFLKNFLLFFILYVFSLVSFLYPQCDGDTMYVELWDSCYHRISTRELFYPYAGLEGDIPFEITLFPEMQRIILPGNNLTGEIPDPIGDLYNLQVIDVSNNQLEGELPPNFWNSTRLELILLHNNNFSGEINNYNLPDLITLRIHDNNFSGYFPESIETSSILFRILIYNNQFSGLIPETIGNLSNLNTLSIFNNQFSGLIPDVICNLIDEQGTAVVLENNQLCPPYPECLYEGQIGFQMTSSCQLCPDIVGDFTLDGVVNVLDVITLVNCIISEVDECDVCFDMNEDQVINIIDIVALVNLIVDN